MLTKERWTCFDARETPTADSCATDEVLFTRSAPGCLIPGPSPLREASERVYRGNVVEVKREEGRNSAGVLRALP